MSKESNKITSIYSPEQMLEYVKNSGLYDQMYSATNNNYMQYMRVSAEGVIIIKRDKHPYLAFFNAPGFDPVRLEDKAKEAVGTRLSGHLVTYKGDYYMCMLEYDKKEDRTRLLKQKDPAMDDPDFIKAISDSLLLDFISRCEINTIPKLNKVLEDERKICLKLNEKIKSLN